MVLEKGLEGKDRLERFVCTMNARVARNHHHSPDESADGQLALGMTGGRTLSNNKGRPPPMLGLRCGIDALDEACDGSTGSCANCFSNLANSSSSCAISRRYTRFCTSTRYWSSLFDIASSLNSDKDSIYRLFFQMLINRFSREKNFNQSIRENIVS